MSRRLRCIPEEKTLVEVTTRTVHGRYLLRPSLLLNVIILGVLARYVWRYGVRCVAFAFVSSHYHLLLEVDDARQLARLRAERGLARPTACYDALAPRGAYGSPRSRCPPQAHLRGLRPLSRGWAAP